jgi:hypothetical protein
MSNKDEIESVRKDIKTYSVLEAVTNSEGGQLIIKGLKKDIASAIDKLVTAYKNVPEVELRATCAALGERITLLRAFTRAPKQKKYAVKELEALLSTVDNDDEDATM